MVRGASRLGLVSESQPDRPRSDADSNHRGARAWVRQIVAARKKWLTLPTKSCGIDCRSLVTSATMLGAMGRLEGKVGIVTGAGGGIGEASARLMAREGASGVVADINGSAAGRVAGEI